MENKIEAMVDVLRGLLIPYPRLVAEAISRGETKAGLEIAAILHAGGIVDPKVYMADWQWLISQSRRSDPIFQWLLFREALEKPGEWIALGLHGRRTEQAMITFRACCAKVKQDGLEVEGADDTAQVLEAVKRGLGMVFHANTLNPTYRGNDGFSYPLDRGSIVKSGGRTPEWIVGEAFQIPGHDFEIVRFTTKITEDEAFAYHGDKIVPKMVDEPMYDPDTDEVTGTYLPILCGYLREEETEKIFTGMSASMAIANWLSYQTLDLEAPQGSDLDEIFLWNWEQTRKLAGIDFDKLPIDICFMTKERSIYSWYLSRLGEASSIAELADKEVLRFPDVIPMLQKAGLEPRDRDDLDLEQKVLRLPDTGGLTYSITDALRA